MKRAVILTTKMNQYRIDFYHHLRDRLRENQIELVIIYGEDTNSTKKDETNLDWGIKIPTKVIKVGGAELYWQPCLKYLKKGDMVIVQQANKLIINYLLIVFRRLFSIKMAYWGHGLNLQLDKSSKANKFKQKLIKYADWWFAYTDGIKKIIVENGFPEEKVTIVENAIDTNTLKKEYQSVSEKQVDSVKDDLSLQSDHVGIFCGGIYKEKRIEFLVESADLIKKQIPDFELIVIGAGPDLSILQDKMTTRQWIHYVGPKFHKEKVPYFKVASVFLMPGLVGLAILDAFALQTPMFTTEYPYHSPEIEYLKNGFNGVMTKNDITTYSSSIINTFKDRDYLDNLIQGCKDSDSHHTVEKMVENFKTGIIKCLKA